MGLYIPGHDVWGNSYTGQLRPDEPREVNGRVLKYETPQGSVNRLDVHPLALDRVRSSTCGIAITEGVKKADALLSQGLPTIGLLGVWNWKGKRAGGGTQILPDFDEINWKRRVVIIYDSDSTTNREVQNAMSRLSAVLQRRGADCYYVDWRRLNA